MGHHEFFQTAPQLLHQAKELVDFGSRTNLLQDLTDLGHPYGLLLGQSSGQSESLLNFFFTLGKGQQKAMLKNPDNGSAKSSVASIPSSWSGFSGEGSAIFSLASILNAAIFNISTGLAFSGGNENSARLSVGGMAMPGERIIDRESWVDRTSDGIGVVFNRSKLFGKGTSITSEDPKMGSGLLTTALSKISSLGGAKSSPEFARKIHMEQLFMQQAFLAPIFLKLFAGEKISSERSRELHIGQNSVGLGTTAIKLATYQGRESFVVKTPQGEPIAQINPGDQLGHLHVSHQAGLMRSLPPLEKAEQITRDFIELFKAVETGGVNLDSKQQEILKKAQNATLIGISHLVRLFRRKTGLPTWKLDVLPELVQRFHQHDSQAVSKAFGGSRKVKPSDVEMMVITPEMRRQLTATTSL